RYVYEAALIGGFVLIGGVAYLAEGMTAAIVAIALFATAGMRLVPALTGVQSATIMAAASVPWVRDVVDDLRGAEKNRSDALSGADSAPFPAQPKELKLTSINFRYPTGVEDVLRGLDVSVPLGSSLG